jgi:hypothetical protein
MAARRVRPDLEEASVLTTAAGGMAGGVDRRRGRRDAERARRHLSGASAGRFGRRGRPFRARHVGLLIREHHGCPEVNNDSPTHAANPLETRL